MRFLFYIFLSVTPALFSEDGGLHCKTALEKLGEHPTRHLSAQSAWDPITLFEDFFVGRQKREFPAGPTRYDSRGQRPNEGIERAEAIQISLPELSWDQVKSLIHPALMEKPQTRRSEIALQDRVPTVSNSGGLSDSQLGEVRREPVKFPTDGRFVPRGSSGTDMHVLELERNNPFLGISEAGFVNYLPLSKWENMENRKLLSQATIQRIVALEKRIGKNALDTSTDPEVAEVRQLMIEDVARGLWDKARVEVASAANEEEVIQAVARFERDFISAHPFLDGNGRTARELVRRLLESRNLPAPLRTHFGEDVTLTPRENTIAMEEGISQRREFEKALREAVQKGEPWEYVPSPALVAHAKDILGDPTREFNGRAFLKWADEHREEFESFEQAVRAFSKSPEGLKTEPRTLTQAQIERAKTVMDKQAHLFNPEEFQMWRRSRGLESDEQFETAIDQYAYWMRGLSYQNLGASRPAHHLPQPERLGAIRLVTPELMESFRSPPRSQEEHDALLSTYFGSETVHRGFGTSIAPTDQALAEVFAVVGPWTLSNGVPAGAGPEKVTKALVDFNTQLLGNTARLNTRIMAHTEGNESDPLYYSSGGLSLSYDKAIARRQALTPEPYSIILSARSRLEGTVDTLHGTPALPARGYPVEFEQIQFGAVAPYSVTKVEIASESVDPSKPGAVIKTARRVSFNEVEITHAGGKVARFRILPGGRVEPLPTE